MLVTNRRSLLALLALAASAGCGSSGDSGGVGRAPARSGDVWVVAGADDRAKTPGAVLAFVHGLHAFVLDGNNAWLGMIHLSARKDAEGARVLTLPGGGGDVRLVEAGATLELRFPGGETVPLQRLTEVSR